MCTLTEVHSADDCDPKCFQTVVSCADGAQQRTLAVRDFKRRAKEGDEWTRTVPGGSATSDPSANLGLFLCRSVQQDVQVGARQPLPVHGPDLHHLPAQGRLRLQGRHGAAGEDLHAGGGGAGGGLVFLNNSFKVRCP